ncbi:MAG: AMP-binding protein, partial [Rhodoplanes sp.]
MSGNLFDLIRSRIASADKTLIETASGERISYGDMLVRSGRLAQALVRREVRPGDRVAVQVEKTTENLMLLLATLRAGAVYLPLNTAYTIAERDYFIGDAEPKLVVCDPAKRDGVSAIALSRNAAVDTLDACGRGSLIDLA